MKKLIITLISTFIVLGLLTGCGCSKKEENKTETNTNIEEQSVLKDQIYEGLEFVNVSASNGIIKTIVVNNTGVTYEGSKFSIKLKDSSGNLIVEIIDKVDTKIQIGSTKLIETKTTVDLTKVSSIEYSIIK